MMIQVQLSSKMWQRQLLFICSSKVVIERRLSATTLITYYAT